MENIAKMPRFVYSGISFVKLMQRKVRGETVLGSGPISFRQVLLKCGIFVVYYFEQNKNVSNKSFNTHLEVLYKMLIL